MKQNLAKHSTALLPFLSALLSDVIWIFVPLKVAVAVITKAGEGELSDYLVNQTKRARPEGPPASFEIQALSSNNVKLQWSDPARPNGPISLYEIRYGYRDHKNQYLESLHESREKSAMLHNLAFNAKYEFKIRACGQLPESVDPICGDWIAKKFTTGIGRK